MVYFDQPIPKPNYIRLLSCSLYNSWFNFKRTGEIAVFDDEGNAATIVNIYAAKDLSSYGFTSYGFELATETNTSVGQLIICNPKNKKN